MLPMSYTYLTQDQQKSIFLQYGGSETNSGATEAQVALHTFRIKHLSEHLKANKHDHVTRRSLLRMVGQRKRLLNYLKHKDVLKYRSLIQELGIRK